MKIVQDTVVIPGITAQVRSTGFVAVDLAFTADPVAFTPEVIASEQARLGGAKGWRWLKEYMRVWEAQAGMAVFEQEWMELQHQQVRSPLYRMRYDTSGYLVQDPHGPIRIYVEPDELPQSLADFAEGTRRSCGIGMDVSEGVEASDSTIQVFFADNLEQAACFASHTVHPADLGRIAVGMARWYNDALICCVRKMHGITTIRTMADECRYPHLWFYGDPKKRTEMKTQQLGWPRGEVSDNYLFGGWVDCIQYNKCHLHDLTTIQQHEQYTYDDQGRIVHQKLASLPVMVRERHGDLVVACALARRACHDLPKFKIKKIREEAPEGSYNARRQRFTRRQRALHQQEL